MDDQNQKTPAGAGPSTVDTGEIVGGAVRFPSWQSSSDKPAGQPKEPDPVEARVGIAVVGLGRLSLEQILPALGVAKKAKLAALVSGTADKLATVGSQYGVPEARRYSYDAFDRVADDPEIQAVYIVLPNARHEEFVFRAAKAGKHVLCEKPMAVDSASAERMTKACRDAGRLLMIAYRSQYEPHVRDAIRLARSGDLGRIKLIDALNIQNQGDPQQWRQQGSLAGGGSLPDVGLYCLNIARAITGEEPIEVLAMITTPKDDPRFKDVEDQVSFTLRFPSGALANCATGYDGHKLSRLIINNQHGWIDIESAFEYQGQRLRVARRGEEVEEITELPVKTENQFALEIDHFADCIRAGRTPRTPGEEGVQDHRLMEAIYQAARERRAVTLPPAEKLDTTRGPPLGEN